MRVVIEVEAGPAAGKRIALRAGQTVQFGRTDWADYAFPADGHMSSVHFSLSVEGSGCFVQDLNSSNGTFVNDRRIAARTAVGEGDHVRAGQSTFVVHLEGEAAGTSSPAAAVRPAADLPVSRAAAPARPVSPHPAAAPPSEVRYSVEKTDSGLTLCRGRVEEIRPGDLAVLLAQTQSPYLIVDFKHVGTPAPPELAAPKYLFDWFDPAVAAAVSPVVIGREDLVAWPALLEEGWGKDGVICLFSAQEKESLLEHLRRACHAKSDAMLGYCWPCVLAPLLSHAPAASVERLLAGIEAVLVEFPDLPVTWQLFGNGQLPALLDRLGFHRESEGNSG